MAKVKPILESIDPGFGHSFRVKKYDDPCRDKKPSWHFHPEIELVYIEGGSGKRHIGNDLSYYHGGDLILIGSNLPHYGFTDRLTGNQSEHIIQMKESIFGHPFLSLPELSGIVRLLERSKRGVVFHGKTKRKVGKMMGKMTEMDPMKRIIQLLNVLNVLADSSEYSILNNGGVYLEVHVEENHRMRIVYRYVRENFKNIIRLEDVADAVSMTVPAFCRYFKKMTGKTFTKFANEYRLVHASKLLAETPSSVSDICFECGFNNFSHFTKQFKLFTGKSPSHYRREIVHVVTEKETIG